MQQTKKLLFSSKPEACEPASNEHSSWAAMDCDRCYKLNWASRNKHIKNKLNNQKGPRSKSEPQVVFYALPASWSKLGLSLGWLAKTSIFKLAMCQCLVCMPAVYQQPLIHFWCSKLEFASVWFWTSYFPCKLGWNSFSTLSIQRVWAQPKNSRTVTPYWPKYVVLGCSFELPTLGVKAYVDVLDFRELQH